MMIAFVRRTKERARTLLPLASFCKRFDILDAPSFPQVARWLYVAGAADDIHALSNDGDSCMLLASLGGHIATCKWLYEAGAAAEAKLEDVDATDDE